MHEYARKTAAWAILLSTELLRIYEIFEKKGVPLIPYKGPVWSCLAFGSPTRRRFDDLDFFVPQEDIAGATALLESAGFASKFEIVDVLTASPTNVPGQYPFSREVTRTQLELHTERTLRYFPIPLNFNKMSRRLITMDLCGRTLRTFSIEDTLMMLCVHGAKHLWDRLLWILDVAQLITIQEVDWSLLSQIAAKLQSTRVLLLGLHLAHDLFDAPLPEKIWQRSAMTKQFETLQKKYMGNTRTFRLPVRERCLARYSGFDRATESARVCAILGISRSSHGKRPRESALAPLARSALHVGPAVETPEQYGSGLKRK